ncbi:MAG TPA: hypothetical protein VFH33_00350, partial [Candidatus Krumholzibacteria bacterium]|nr:hypothetical protein [Candidatus Krumholzibacteria bacterium]
MNPLSLLFVLIGSYLVGGIPFSYLAGAWKAGDSGAVPGAPATPPVKLSVAVSNGHLYLGTDDFVATALDQDPVTSLASNARLQS